MMLAINFFIFFKGATLTSICLTSAVSSTSSYMGPRYFYEFVAV